MMNIMRALVGNGFNGRAVERVSDDAAYNRIEELNAANDGFLYWATPRRITIRLNGERFRAVVEAHIHSHLKVSYMSWRYNGARRVPVLKLHCVVPVQCVVEHFA